MVFPTYIQEAYAEAGGRALAIYLFVKVHIFGEGHKMLRNLHQLFVLCTASQIIGGDFAKFCGLLRIYEL